jgi:hypothetical protein
LYEITIKVGFDRSAARKAKALASIIYILKSGPKGKRHTDCTECLLGIKAIKKASKPVSTKLRPEFTNKNCLNFSPYFRFCFALHFFITKFSLLLFAFSFALPLPLSVSLDLQLPVAFHAFASSDRYRL